ncbi:unnamed protein product [Malassezia sympodialis ATCC 42132]|uniref:uncharacterized protein n=1 Tax=Malassezia sympodialis (strain ATCC 42132) TaxID=1230383 RepID=UPI0002C1AD86|nr:uncharacterized protein MSY001_1628 [Malassezia sympodialis ATCC 42132]CCU98922.1 unnamed protein product [Malassezia sympodialis ATCC 42132]|eukprot:XP_018740198.1 uncharacterized protein MSY001_1628 [Malassezia sympodialis ATCC 42132]
MSNQYDTQDTGYAALGAPYLNQNGHNDSTAQGYYGNNMGYEHDNQSTQHLMAGQQGYDGQYMAQDRSHYASSNQNNYAYGAQNAAYPAAGAAAPTGTENDALTRYHDATSDKDGALGTSRPKSRKWLWWLIAAIVLICVILAAVLGGVLGSRSSNDDDNDNTSAPNSSVGTGNPQNNVASAWPRNVVDAASKAASNGKTDKLAFTGTDFDANTAKPSKGSQVGSCGNDPWKATNNLNNGRPGHPRLIAPQYQWDCLQSKIENDAYLTVWNYTIFQNATKWLDEDPVTYDVDGGLTLSGILDVSRIVQQRLKAWAYAWRLTKDTKYRDRAYKELSVAAGNTSQPFGDGATRWNPPHFLDTAEMIAAYAFAYDWMYDAWDDQQKSYIVDWIVTFGLQQGLDMYNNGSAWWSQPQSGNGNWNCVCNGGLVFGALAIQNDVQGAAKDTTNSILQKALDNAKQNCMRGVYKDGTWSETPNYWYFGTNGHARMLSALITATGSDQGLMANNKNWYKTGDFHMYVTGNAGMFFYGDNGPNKFSTTANQLFLFSQQTGNPVYALFQRDRADAAADPLSMFWYDTSSKGGFYNGLALDKYFDNKEGSWVSMRSSWTDMTGNYIAMKSSNMTGHQTHGDLDAGDFVIDALGVRFAGEYGSDNYLSKNYFASEDDGADRWKYFRKGTQGQNTIVIGQQNQNASCLPTNKFESSNDAQNGDLSFTPGEQSTAYFVTDMSQCYAQSPAGSVKRGIRFLKGRRQMLIQDEIKKPGKPIEWRVQTNATVTLSKDKKTATMKIKQVRDPNAPKDPLTANIDEVTMLATITSPQDATFDVRPAYDKSKSAPNYYYGADVIPPQDKDDAGNPIQPEVLDYEASVLSIALSGNNDANIQVWWQPQYSQTTDADKAPPKNVALDQWSLTSH